MAHPQIATIPKQESPMRNHLVALLLSFINGSSTPDPIRLSLEAESTKWFTRVVIFGFVVALGCVCEIWDVAFNLRNWCWYRRTGRELRDNPGSWKHPLAAFGLLLVVGGIVGETVCEVFVSNADASIRSHESDVISAAETKAVDAEGRLGPLEKEAGQLNKDAEGERLARVQIEASTAWRRLTEAQKSEMGKQLLQLKPERITLWYLQGGAETANFSTDIAEMLRKGGMFVFPPRGLAPSTTETVRVSDPIKKYVTGVEIASTSDPASSLLAKKINALLNDNGFDSYVELKSDAPASVAKNIGLPNVIVAVMARPDGPQGEFKLQAEREVAKAKSK